MSGENERKLSCALLNNNEKHQPANCQHIKTLVEQGANVNCVAGLCGTDGYLSPIHAAMVNSCTDCLRLILPRVNNIDVKDSDGDTALIIAAKNDEVELAKILLESGADAEVANNTGNTPLHIACSRGNETISALLVRKCPKAIAMQSTNVKTAPLHLAVMAGSISCVKLLLRRGANKDCKAHEGVTAMHLAAVLGQRQMVQYLLDRGADSMALTDEERLPLHSACTHGRTEVADVLLRHYPKAVNAKSKTKSTPLHEAASGGGVNCVKLLLKKGADTTAKNANGQLPIDVAREMKDTPPPPPVYAPVDRSHEEVIRLLRQHKGSKKTYSKSKERRK